MPPHIRPPETVDLGMLLSDLGLTDRDNAAVCGVAIKTIRRWRRLYQRRGITRCANQHTYACPKCNHEVLNERSYARLLGWYLGDGHIVRARASYLLAIINDARYVGLNAEVIQLVRQVRGGRSDTVRLAPGCVRIETRWKHWPCLFPQHGPGRKHERAIVLEPWQQEIVDRYPGDLLRGLFHSDGCRFTNPVVKQLRDGPKRYTYPRYMFTNQSADIRALCTDALDRLGVAWRYSRSNTVSVARREAVALLDQHVGPKY